MRKVDYDELHRGRYSGSKLGCHRARALHVLGYEPQYKKKLLTKFEEGLEHDEEMKKEALEEFDDFIVPGSTILKLTRDGTIAEISLSPDGLRTDEVVEFKGLAASLWNSLRTEEDLKRHSALTAKYHKQVHAYGGAFKKPLIRFRIKNKKNLKVKDIVFKTNPKIWKQIKHEIMDIQEVLDEGGLPPRTCDRKEEKYCPYRTVCREQIAEEIESIKEKPLSYNTKSTLARFAELYLTLKKEIEDREKDQAKLIVKVKEIMREHGQREQELVPGTIKYGVRYKDKANQEDVDRLIEEGKIRVDQRPEEYCAIYAKGEEEKEYGQYKRLRRKNRTSSED